MSNFIRFKWITITMFCTGKHWLIQCNCTGEPWNEGSVRLIMKDAPLTNRAANMGPGGVQTNESNPLSRDFCIAWSLRSLLKYSESSCLPHLSKFCWVWICLVNSAEDRWMWKECILLSVVTDKMAQGSKWRGYFICSCTCLKYHNV